jgi:hypothetical protein
MFHFIVMVVFIFFEIGDLACQTIYPSKWINKKKVLPDDELTICQTSDCHFQVW